MRRPTRRSNFTKLLFARDLCYRFSTPRLFLQSQPTILGHSTKPVFNSYAFVEFRDGRDAERAYHDMHGREFDGYRLSVQWARKPPSAAWRSAESSAPPSRSDRDSRARSRSPRPRSPDRRRERDTEPRRRHSSRERARDEARTPPPAPYATPMAPVDEYEKDRRRDSREYRESRGRDRDYRDSSRDRRDNSRDRAYTSRDGGDRRRDNDDGYRRDEGAALDG
ncbi:hypothetical protein EV360DRAFT_90176 [Lentinula raphanica]|nr:hypothetical protein EV360DRAFT_90176 [Lentinula raphanica]